VVDKPVAQKGTSFEIGPEVTVGRAAGCHIALPDDTFVSQLHARVFERSGQVYVEDLGSTNGTYVNGHRVSAPTPMHRGDSLQVGSTILEAV
jgi:pSer/pThr/pTyr-binding forkhead associated (FHA) protein